jgi:hypothetical protein
MLQVQLKICQSLVVGDFDGKGVVGAGCPWGSRLFGPVPFDGASGGGFGFGVGDGEGDCGVGGWFDAAGGVGVQGADVEVLWCGGSAGHWDGASTEKECVDEMHIIRLGWFVAIKDWYRRKWMWYESDARRRLTARKVWDWEIARSYSYMKILSLLIRRIKQGYGKPSEEQYRWFR